MSSGERTFLMIVASLGSDAVDVNLSDTIIRLDRPTLELVLAGIAHAAGSHQHSGLVHDDAGAATGFEQLSSLYPWPARPTTPGAGRSCSTGRSRLPCSPESSCWC
ncbi:hypothetical protein [Nakamurella panacisegetis]|uniref:hypothetical protein n=1 Tax=Nakamurella panacisegetis TaxID=1090615 RepID=UPI0018D2777C|nr:hypothetical protein [Nakamurella panacisegetis]